MSAASDSPIKSQTRTIDGLSIRYAESDGDCEVDALLVSPWPESLYCFEPTATTASALAAVLASLCLCHGGSRESALLLQCGAVVGSFHYRIREEQSPAALAAAVALGSLGRERVTRAIAIVSSSSACPWCASRHR